MIHCEYDLDKFRKTIENWSCDPHFQMELISDRIGWLVKIFNQQPSLKEKRSSKMLIDAYLELFSKVYFRQQLRHTDNP
jgi:hypothetical protein